MANEKVTIQHLDGTVVATQNEGTRSVSISAEKQTHEVWVQTADAKNRMVRELMATDDGHVWIKHYKPNGELPARMSSMALRASKSWRRGTRQ